MLRPALVLTLLAGLASWGFTRTRPARETVYPLVWGSEEQVLPPGVPTHVRSPFPEEPSERDAWIQVHSVLLDPLPRKACFELVLLPAHDHALICGLGEMELEKLLGRSFSLAVGEWLPARVSAQDVLDDDDEDGFCLDPGELALQAGGVVCWVTRRRDAAGPLAGEGAR